MQPTVRHQHEVAVKRTARVFASWRRKDGLWDQAARLGLYGADNLRNGHALTITGRMGITSKVADRLEVNTSHRRSARQREINDRAHCRDIHAGHQRGHKHHADLVLRAPLDGSYLFRKQVGTAQMSVDAIVRAVELQEYGCQPGLFEC